MVRLEALQPGVRITGLVPDMAVLVVARQEYGPDALEVIYKTAGDTPQSALLYRPDEQRLSLVEGEARLPFDGDGAWYRLAAEAQRIRLAHLYDPWLAIHTARIDPLPHQITAVYERMLPRQPLRFLLADDPGAGKTIMAGLLIRELIVRGDLRRCLIVCPGSLAEQWQDELYEKFRLSFEILTNEGLDAAASGNWFLEHDRIIARLDKLSRDEAVQNLLEVPESRWDLVVVDEAHKMSATVRGKQVKYTRRYQLGQLLARMTRHLLLMTATPHNGRDSDFLQFLALLDEDRFVGQHRDSAVPFDISDLMRRMVKENLYRFDGKRLFPERIAETVPFELTGAERDLYREVTDYVREEFNRAEKLENPQAAQTVGFALTILQRRLASSPEAIWQSLHRRRERLEARLLERQSAGHPDRDGGAFLASPALPLDPDDDEAELDDLPDNELQDLEDTVLDQATAARSLDELRLEIARLQQLEDQAQAVRQSGEDRKWQALLGLLDEIFPPQILSATEADEPLPKLVIFTEHRDTLRYLYDRITIRFGRPEAVVQIHGGLRRAQRLDAQEAFRHEAEVRVLLATDAAGEGINLQRAHLMVNYDLPWNPNRLEQRFGRIHRIGQTKVCRLWNLVASHTREGDVYQTLLQKLDDARAALGGQVFDVLGKLQFEGQSLRQLLIKAIRADSRPEVTARFHEVVAGAVDTDRLRELLADKALSPEMLDSAARSELRHELERASARRLQPHFVESFFREAFARLGGRGHRRETCRFQISHVPEALRRRARTLDGGPTLARSYERITFEPDHIEWENRPTAEFVCPGHPLLDATISEVLARHGDLLRQGAVLVDDADPGTTPRVLLTLDHRLQDATVDPSSGAPTTVSRRVFHVELCTDGQVRPTRPAPYLDFRPLVDGEPTAAELLDRPECRWITGSLKGQAVRHAVEHLIPEHLDEVRRVRVPWLDKVGGEVRSRLLAEIAHWDRRAIELREDEKAGKINSRLNAAEAEQRAADLRERLAARRAEIGQQLQITPLPPIVIGGLVVVPAGLLAQCAGQPPAPAADLDTQAVAAEARRIVMEAERRLGHDPVDVEFQKLGYDIESRERLADGTTRLRFLEVKGRRAGSETVTVTLNEILTALNEPERFILAIVEFAPDGSHQVHYLREPFPRQHDFQICSVNYHLDKLIDRASPPV